MAGDGGRKLTVQVIGDIADIKKDVASVDKSLSGLDKASKAFTKQVKMMGAAIVGAFAVDAVVDFFSASVKAAAEEEAGIKKLTVAISENDRAWDGNIAKVEAVIDAREKLAFADNEQRDSLARLVSVTKDLDTALRLQRIAMDFARLRGMDLVDAGELIGKVYGGNIGILSRYGIQLKRGTTATEALAELQKRSAGQAEAYADTTAGAMSTLAIEIENLQEDIGKELLPVMKDLAIFARDNLVPAFKDVVRVLKDAASFSDELGTIMQVLTMDFAAQNRAAQDWFASLDPWVQRVESIGDSVGYTRTQLFALSQEMKKGGKSFEDFETFLISMIPEVDLAKDEIKGLGGTFAGDLPDDVQTGVAKVQQDLSSLVGISRTTLKTTRDEIAARMRDIKDALTHPFRDNQLEKVYRDGIRRGTAAMKKALRTGNEEAYAEASAFVRDMKAKLAELTRQKRVIRIQMEIERTGQIPGWALLGFKSDPAKKPKKHAAGLDNVPYDNYPALLHKGERVMTASENRWGSGMGGRMSVVVNNYIAPGGDLVEAGRQTVRAIQEYEKRAGRTWRN